MDPKDSTSDSKNLDILWDVNAIALATGRPRRATYCLKGAAHQATAIARIVSACRKLT
jgi:hypothetical protein